MVAAASLLSQHENIHNIAPHNEGVHSARIKCIITILHEKWRSRKQKCKENFTAQVKTGHNVNKFAEGIS